AEVDNYVETLSRRDADPVVHDGLRQQAAVAADLYERAAAGGRGIERQFEAARIGRVEQAEAIADARNIEHRPRCAVDEHDIAQHPPHEGVRYPGLLAQRRIERGLSDAATIVVVSKRDPPPFPSYTLPACLSGEGAVEDIDIELGPPIDLKD